MTTLRCFLALLLFACAAAPLHAQKPADPKPLEAMLGKALAAYHAGDSKAFYADYAKMMASVATDQANDMMFRNICLKTHGKYVSRKLLKAESSVFEDTPLMVFEAVFEKTKRVKISVNFMKEDGVYRIMQMQFAPM